MPFIQIGGPRLPKVLAYVLYQELLCAVGEGLRCDILDTDQLLVELVVPVSAVHTVEILDVLCVGSGNAYMANTTCQFHAVAKDNYVYL